MGSTIDYLIVETASSFTIKFMDSCIKVITFQGFIVNVTSSIIAFPYFIEILLGTFAFAFLIIMQDWASELIMVFMEVMMEWVRVIESFLDSMPVKEVELVIVIEA